MYIIDIQTPLKKFNNCQIGERTAGVEIAHIMGASKFQSKLQKRR